MLTKNLPFEYKLDTGNRTFEGYASTFGNADLVGDVVQKGAFKKTIQERFEQSQQIKILWQHFEPLGKPLAMSEDDKGLHVKGYISKTELGNDALTLMSDGVIDSMSIGYDIVKDSLSEDGKTRKLNELKLWEFSLVTFPANPEAVVTGMKSFNSLIQELKGQNISDFIKAGAVLSKANKQKIEGAITALQDVLNIDPSSNDSQKNDPDLKEFSQLVSDMQDFTKKLKGGQ